MSLIRNLLYTTTKLAFTGGRFLPLKEELEAILPLGGGLGKTPPEAPSLILKLFSGIF